MGDPSDRLHAVLRAARPPPRGWHQGPRRRRHRRAGARPRGARRGGEPPRGPRRARGARASTSTCSRVRDLAGLDAQMGGLAAAVGATWEPIGAPPEPEPTRRAWVPIWKRPWMALGEPTYGSALLRALGVSNVAAADGAYPEMDPDAARAARRRPGRGAERAVPVRRAAPGRARARPPTTCGSSTAATCCGGAPAPAVPWSAWRSRWAEPDHRWVPL